MASATGSSDSFFSHVDQFEFKGDFDDLDITSEAIDFDEVGDDLEKFQQDEILRKVLSEGVERS